MLDARDYTKVTVIELFTFCFDLHTRICTFLQSIGRRRPAVVHVPEVSQTSQGIRRRRRGLTRDVPIAQSGGSRYLGANLRTRRHRDAPSRRRIGVLPVGVVVRWRSPRAPVDFHVLPETRGVRVGFIATGHPTVVRFVRRVNVRVLLPIRRVGESPITAFVLTFERFLTWK